MKLRPNAGMPDVAPVNGRNLTADDVVYSWERWKSGDAAATTWRTRSTQAPRSSLLRPPDAATVVITLQQPISSILSTLANQAGGTFFILPTEAEDLDPSHATRRRRPVLPLRLRRPALVSLTSATRTTTKLARLFPDVIEPPSSPSVATGLAQLKSGGLHYYNVTAGDILPPSTTCRQLNLYQSDFQTVGRRPVLRLSAGEGTPLRDVRMRQAWSMMMDRDSTSTRSVT